MPDVPQEELAAVAEPTLCRRIRGILFEPGHPWAIDEGKCRPVLAQQVGKAEAEPGPMRHLERVGWTTGKLAPKSV